MRAFASTSQQIPGPTVARLIEEGDLGALREHMHSGPDPGCHTMNASLEKLLAGHKISVEDAQRIALQYGKRAIKDIIAARVRLDD